MMHTARKDQRLFGQLLFYAGRGNAVRQNGAALRLCRVPTLFFESLAPLAKPYSAPANLKHCNTLPGWQYTGQMTAGGQCSPLRRNFLLSFLIIFYSIISIFYNAR